MMTVILGLILVGLGALEYAYCERIVHFFDPNSYVLNSSAKQNVLITSAIFIIAGLAIIIIV